MQHCTRHASDWLIRRGSGIWWELVEDSKGKRKIKARDSHEKGVPFKSVQLQAEFVV